MRWEAAWRIQSFSFLRTLGDLASEPEDEQVYGQSGEYRQDGSGDGPENEDEQESHAEVRVALVLS